MKGRFPRWTATVLALSGLLLAGCSSPNESRTVVASFYPLAFAAERVAGPGWEVIDLTPPGTEAHDVELSLEDRSAIEDAEVLLYLGDIGFQPQVEDAVSEIPGRVVAVTEGIPLAAPIPEEEEGEEEHAEETADPHAWLDPALFALMVDRVADGLAAADPNAAAGYRDRAAALQGELEALDRRFRADLEGCDTRSLVVSHEAFGYLAEAYGLEQLGLTGLAPEAEPTVERLGAAGAALADGRATAVFFEAGGEARRIAESVAADFGVPALPLGTLESEPPSGDYLSVMEDNLGSLRRGLGCE
ncbi:MAG: metal ABC transporter substrate-binding protein [Actinomycetota bacterium]